MGDYGLWHGVLLNVAFFTIFMFSMFRPFKRKMECLPAGIYTAFVIALYTEMYGFPLIIFVLSAYFGRQIPFTHGAGHVLLGMIGCHIGTIMMGVGLLLVYLGWTRIHKAKGKLVTDGVYRYVRHPQYLGLLLLTGGMIVQWFTFITILMWPILTFLYYRLAKKEERDLEKRFGERYLRYKRKVPMITPFARSLFRFRILKLFHFEWG